MPELVNIEFNLKLLFNERPALWNADYNTIIWNYWQKYDYRVFDSTRLDPRELTNMLSLDRAIRKLRNNGYGNSNQKQQEEYKEYVRL